MVDRSQSNRERRDAQKADRQEAMDDAIAEGRLVVRQMTPQERDESDARSAAAKETRAVAQAAKARATRPQRRYPGKSG